MEKNTIVICMGSSCFARGNDLNLKIIKEYLLNKGIREKVFIKGTLCMKKCTKGPNITINGKIFHNVRSSDIENILKRELVTRESEKNA